MNVWDYINAKWQLQLRDDPGLATDCSYREKHRPHHVSFPEGRPVCLICHPPPETLK